MQESPEGDVIVAIGKCDDALIGGLWNWKESLEDGLEAGAEFGGEVLKDQIWQHLRDGSHFLFAADVVAQHAVVDSEVRCRSKWEVADDHAIRLPPAATQA